MPANGSEALSTISERCARPFTPWRDISESIARRRRSSRAAFLVEVVRQHALGALGARSQAVQGAGSLRTSRCAQIPVKWNVAYCGGGPAPVALSLDKVSCSRRA